MGVLITHSGLGTDLGGQPKGLDKVKTVHQKGLGQAQPVFNTTKKRLN